MNKLITVFNIITAIVGFGKAFMYVCTDVYGASWEHMWAILGITCLVSVVGTFVLASIDGRIQDANERRYAKMLSSAYRSCYRYR